MIELTTEYEKNKILMDGLIRKFNKYKIDGIIKDFGSATFSWLQTNRFLEISNEDKMKIFEISPKSKPENKDKDKIAARLLTLKTYFDCLIEKKIDIQQIIEGEFITIDIIKKLEL